MENNNTGIKLDNLPTLNIAELEKIILMQLASEGRSNVYISKKTGISERNLYRKFKLYSTPSAMDVKKSIALLEKVGYEIVKK